MWRETHLWPAQQSSPSTLASITRGNSLSYWPWLVPSRDSVSTVPSWSKLTRVQYSFGTEDTYSLFTDCCSLTFPFCRLLQRGGGGWGDAAVLGYGGEGRRGVSYLLSGHELETYIHTYFIIFPERAFQRQYAWDVSTWDVNQTRRRRRENNRNVVVALVVALVVVVVVEGKQ